MKDRRKRLLYLMEREDGALKIGSSVHPAGRMRDLEKAQGFRFVLLREWKHPDAFLIERMVHKSLWGNDLAENGGDETYWISLDVALRTIRDVMREWKNNHQMKEAS